MDIKDYSITFRDRKERTVVITITNLDISTGQSVELQPAGKPLTISEDDDHDPMKPIRASVAQIRVICTHAHLIPITHNLQWHVVVRRAGTVIWAGYLRTQMPDADYSPIQSEVFYTADDMMGAWQYRKQEMSGYKHQLGSILPVAFTLIDNSMPITARGQLPHTTLSALEVFTQNWLSMETNDEGSENTVLPTYWDVASDIFEWLGMTARYYMGKYYLGTLFGTKCYDSAVEMTLAQLDGSQFVWTGFHEIKVEQGKGHIRVAAEGRRIEDASIPNVVGNDYHADKVRYLPPQTAIEYGSNAHNCYTRELVPNENSGIVLVTSNAGTPGNVFGQRGVNAIDLDVWGDDRQKSNYAFTRALLVVGVGLNTDNTTDAMPTFRVDDYTSALDVYTRCRADMIAGLTEPIMTITSKSPIYAKNGGFTLRIERRNFNFSVVTQSGNVYRRPTELGTTEDMKQSGIYVICSLKHGNRYWTGQNWDTTPSKFLYMDSQTRIKTLDMMFEGGTAGMPINANPGDTTIVGGTATLSIYGIYYYTEEQIDDGGRITYICRWMPEEITMLSAVELKYNKELNLLDTDLSSASTLNEYTSGMPAEDEKSVILRMNSRSNIKDNWGMVYRGTSVVDTLHWPKLREDWAPERFVLKRNVLSLSRMRSYATLSIECEYGDLPFRRIAMDGRTWYPLAVSTDMQTCTSELLMMDITDIMAELPEVGTDEESSGGEYDIYVTADGTYVTLTMESAFAVDVTVEWSTDTESGTETIPRGTSSITFDVGSEIHDERDIGFYASTTEGDTFNFVYDL